MFRRASAITVPGIVLSQPEIVTSASKCVGGGDELDRVGDQLARDERGAHPGGAHRDPVGDRDRVQLHRRAAGGTDALLDLRGEDPVVEVAGHRLDPRVRDADDRLGEILGGVADPVQVGARGGALGALGEGAALVADVEAHACSVSARSAPRGSAPGRPGADASARSRSQRASRARSRRTRPGST